MSREWDLSRGIPDRLIMEVKGLPEWHAGVLADDAVEIARTLAPKMSGASSRRLAPIWGDGFFGVRWQDPHVWYQEVGTRPFTMRSLAGKTIPMWVRDPDGELRRKNPRIETMIAADGRTLVRIFRKAAPIGSRKNVTRQVGGNEVVVDVPRSYPGAPGRINRREPRRPWTTPGKVGGQIATGNVGVRWRHPGMSRKAFIRNGLVTAAEQHGITPRPIRDNYGRFR